MTPKIKKHLHDLLSLSKKFGGPLYLVGGTVRDSLLKRAYSDYDFSSSQAVSIAREFSEKSHSKLVPLDDTPGRQTSRVVLGKNLFFDFSQMQGNTLEEDLGKRDFTINAMGLALQDFMNNDLNQIVDPHDGRRDLSHKILRVLPGRIFSEDPLRMVRAFRFAHTLGFEIEPKTLKEISRHKSDLSRVAGERISYELMILLNTPKTQIGLIHRSGLLDIIFPEAQALRGERDATTKVGGWEKSLAVLDTLNRIFSDDDTLLKKYRAEISDFLSGDHRRALIRLAGLLILCGQPHSQTSYKKSKKNSTLTQVLKRLRMSNSAIDFVDRTLFFSQRVIFHALDFAPEKIDEPRVYALIKECHGELISSILLAVAMHTETSGNEEKFHQAVERIADFYFKKFLPAKNKPPLLTGHILEKKFKLNPSPSYKTILDQVEEAQVLGTITTPQEAEAMAHALIKNL